MTTEEDAERFAAYDRWLETLRAVAEEMRRSWPELASQTPGRSHPASSGAPDPAQRSVP